jgi:hypothetical protein
MQRSSCVRFLHGQECKSRCFPTICHTKAARGTIAGSPFEHRRPFTRSVEFPKVALLAQPWEAHVAYRWTAAARPATAETCSPRDLNLSTRMTSARRSLGSLRRLRDLSWSAEWRGAAELQMRRSALMTPELNAWPESTVADVQPAQAQPRWALVPGELPCGAAGRHACRDFRARAVSRSC